MPLAISLSMSTPADRPIAIHHCEELSGARRKRACMPGSSITVSVRATTSRIVSHSHLLLKNLSVNRALPERMENIIVNCENTITPNVIVRATSTEVCIPIK